MAKSNWVRFDWAMKRLLRQKSNFVVLEGFLTCLLGRQVRIVEILESEGNKRDAEDKFNRVDILATDENKEKFIIEIQNNRELDYFHRMLYGVSRVVLDFLHEGEPYGDIRKVYSINIVYFDLGQGQDYVYYGRTEFEGIHVHDILRLSSVQQKQFMLEAASDIFPEYYVLRVNEFDQLAKTPLDEWVRFLKTGEIDANTVAPGLPEARERLRRDRLSLEEQRAYDYETERLRYQRSVISTSRIEGLEEGREEGRILGMAEGRAKGLAEGKAEGIVEGRIEGRMEGRMEGRAEGIIEGRTEGRAEGLEIGRMEGWEKGLQEGREEGMNEGHKKAQLTIARNLLSMGVAPEKVIEATGLTWEELQ